MSDTDIYSRLIEGASYSEELVLEVSGGEEMTFTMYPLTRSQKFDFIKAMPEGLLEDIEDEDTTAEDTVNKNDIPDGDGIKAMEKVIITSLRHSDLSNKEIARLVKHTFEDEVVFELSTRIVEFSMDISGVTGFRQA